MRRLWWNLWLTCFVAIAAGPACASRPPPPGRLADEAEMFVRLGLALAERDPDSLDMYGGPPEWRAAAAREERTLGDIRDSARALGDRIDHQRPEDAVRADHLLQQARALRARAEILTGARLRFDEESWQLFGTAVAPADRVRIAAVRDELDHRLPGRGSLQSRYAAYRRTFLVPESRRVPLLERALAECRRRTRDHLALPSAEQITIAWRSHTPWPAFTRYDGSFHSRLELNAALAVTVDGALDIACHEGYPGHHTIAVLRDVELVRHHRRIEYSLQLLFSSDAARSEGLATVAPEIAFDDGERARFERTALLPLAGLPTDLDVDAHVRIERLVTELRRVQVDIARQYVDGELEFARAAAQLESEALVTAPDGFLKFVNQFRTYPVAYVAGADLVRQVLDGTTGGDRWNTYRELALYARDLPALSRGRAGSD